MAEDQEPGLFAEGRPGRAVQPGEGVGVRVCAETSRSPDERSRRGRPDRVIQRRSCDRPGRQPVVAWVDHGMIDQKGRSRRGPQMSATPDSTLANPEQRIADLERQLAEREAELAEAGKRE